MFTSGQGNMPGRVAHLWANIKPAWVLRERITHEETLSAHFWWMSLPLLFYSMVANITDTVSWKEFVLPLRCEMHIDYRAPWVSCPWQGWYWLEPALAVNYGGILPICLQLNYLYNGQMILRSLQARIPPLDPLARIKSFISNTSEEKQVHLDFTPAEVFSPRCISAKMYCHSVYSAKRTIKKLKEKAKSVLVSWLALWNVQWVSV